MIHKIISGASALLCFFVLQGCGSGEKNAPASQVAARVNSGEITVYRVNSALGNAAGATDASPQTVAKTRRVVLDSLIDQELAAQAAENAKLDRTPAVVQAMEAARRDVLARAWLERLSASVAKPDPAQVSRYYADHPELFSQRRVFDLQQIMLPTADAKVLGQLKEQVDAKASMQQLRQWLDENQVKYAVASGVRAAEQVPLDIMADLGKAKDGQTLLVQQAKSALIVHVVSSSLQPVSEAAAAPRIRKFLANQAWSNAVAAEMKHLKQSASITYLGEFATPDSLQKPVVATATASSAGNTNVNAAAHDNTHTDAGMETLYKEIGR